MDKNSLKYLDEDDGVAAWDNTAPLPLKMDSGMVSLVRSSLILFIVIVRSPLFYLGDKRSSVSHQFLTFEKMTSL